MYCVRLSVHVIRGKRLTTCSGFLSASLDELLALGEAPGPSVTDDSEDWNFTSQKKDGWANSNTVLEDDKNLLFFLLNKR